MSDVQGILNRFEKNDDESSPPPTTDGNFERNEDLRKSLRDRIRAKNRRTSKDKTFAGSPKRSATKHPVIPVAVPSVKYIPPDGREEKFTNDLKEAEEGSARIHLYRRSLSDPNLFSSSLAEASKSKKPSIPPKPPQPPKEGKTGEDENINVEREKRPTTTSSYDSDDDIPIGDPTDFDEDDEQAIEEEVEFLSNAHKVAYELLTSERSYVKKLSLLDQVFYFNIDNENRALEMFPIEVPSKIFSNIKPIYLFHKDHFLPALEDRLFEWSSKPFMGDVMNKWAPFFRMYSEYVKNFDNAMKLLDEWQNRSPKFTSLVEKLQKDKRNGNLTLQHHMLEPVQRIPRYQLLLQDYLKKLNPSSDDKEPTENALSLIKNAAQNSNNTMRLLESFQKLVDINSQLEGAEIVKPCREFVKEGKMVKLSARRGEPQERYLFLFNDLLLCCNLPSKIGNRKPNYKVRSNMDINGMEITESEIYTHAFRIRSKEKSVEFQGSSEEESQEWKKLIEEAIIKCEEKRKTFEVYTLPRRYDTDSSRSEVTEEFVLGERAPTWVRDGDANLCMRCGTDFTLTKRKHHCRACGHVVCSRCSENNVPLKWENDKPSRVCIKCYYIFKVPKMVKEKDEDFSCFVYIPENSALPNIFRRRSWAKCWMIIRGASLHLYESSMLDHKPKLSLPLADYEPEEIEEEDNIDRPHSFKLHYQSKIHYFSVDSPELKDQLFQTLFDVFKHSKTK